LQDKIKKPNGQKDVKITESWHKYGTATKTETFSVPASF
jgi:hypothetical protein